MDETYIKVNGTWKYLYRAVDKQGQTVDFLLTAKRDAAAARRFFEKAIRHNGVPGKITMCPCLGFTYSRLCSFEHVFNLHRSTVANG
jgi:transposase-like protein